MMMLMLLVVAAMVMTVLIMMLRPPGGPPLTSAMYLRVYATMAQYIRYQNTPPTRVEGRHGLVEKLSRNLRGRDLATSFRPPAPETATPWAALYAMGQSATSATAYRSPISLAGLVIPRVADLDTVGSTPGLAYP